MNRVLIQPADYESISGAVEKVFELFPLSLSGKKVLIKPNLLRASKFSEGIVTHPALVRAVVDFVEKEKPSSLIVGDNPGLFNYGANEEVFEATGIMEAAGGYYKNIGTDSVKVPFNPDFMESVSLSRDIMEADIVISLPKFKTHGLTVLSGAIKNSYGFLPGAQKAHIHKRAGSPEPFHRAIVDVFRIRIPDLFIVDAVVGMEGNGPASPDLRDIGLLLASDNGVALDSVIAHMMGLDPKKLTFLKRAEETGLGETDLERIEITGELKQIPGFKIPPLGGEALMENRVIQDLIKNRISLLPVALEEKCTSCETCVEQCPVNALFMKDDLLPVVDPDLCITCFCCQEICPEKAIELR